MRTPRWPPTPPTWRARALRLSGLLADLLPDEPEVLGLAALIRFTESRRPARLDACGAMIPLSEQDVSLWDSRADRRGRGADAPRRRSWAAAAPTS